MADNTMNDALLQDYFKRDLSPAEDERLARLLADSPEAAERFALLAELDAKRLGFTRGHKGLAWGASAFLVAAGIAWLALPADQPAPPRPSLSVEGAAFSTETSPSENPAPAPREEKEVPAAQPELLVSALHQGVSARLEGGRANSATIYDRSGRRLAAMRPQGGEWVWDGRVSTGEKAPRGVYEVRVTHAKGASSAWVQVE